MVARRTKKALKAKDHPSEAVNSENLLQQGVKHLAGFDASQAFWFSSTGQGWKIWDVKAGSIIMESQEDSVTCFRWTAASDAVDKVGYSVSVDRVLRLGFLHSCVALRQIPLNFEHL